MTGGARAARMAIVGIAWLLPMVACVACVKAFGGAAETGYTGELLACVDDAGTLAQSKACRAAVDQRWGVVRRTEGGAP